MLRSQKSEHAPDKFPLRTHRSDGNRLGNKLSAKSTHDAIDGLCK